MSNKGKNPSLADYSVTITVMMTMRRIIGSIVKKQSSGGKWLISEKIVDTMRLYIYCSGDEVDEVFNAEMENMANEQDGLGQAI